PGFRRVAPAALACRSARQQGLLWQPDGQALAADFLALRSPPAQAADSENRAAGADAAGGDVRCVSRIPAGARDCDDAAVSARRVRRARCRSTAPPLQKGQALRSLDQST